MRVAIAGAGYVGLSNAVLLAQHNSVTVMEPNEDKVKKINSHISPIVDPDISSFLSTHALDLVATSDEQLAYSKADYVLIATPTDYDETARRFDTSTVEQVIASVRKFSKTAIIVIKSTVPIGFTNYVSEIFRDDNIFFSPEFLREGQALHDCLYPSRIIVGHSLMAKNSINASKIVDLLIAGVQSNQPNTLIMGASEAEAVKLFANAYLAMRVGFFNEMDTYAELKGLNTREIIEGVGLDPRIGLFYNNPSYGYGGYCLPKDSKQLLSNYNDVPQNLISAIVTANETRKSFIVSQVLKRKPKIVGIYRLTMKSGSDNFRESSIQDIMQMLAEHNLQVVIYEPIWESQYYRGFEVISDLERFIESSDVILANRTNEEISAYSEKVYTRDLYMKN